MRLMWLPNLSVQCVVLGFYKLDVNESKLLILCQGAKFNFKSTMNHNSFRVISSWTATSLIDRLIILGRSQELREKLSTLESTGT